MRVWCSGSYMYQKGVPWFLDYNGFSLADVMRNNQPSRLSPSDLLKFRNMSIYSNYDSDFSTFLAS